jgi:iron complex outermembrane receptor protein
MSVAKSRRLLQGVAGLGLVWTLAASTTEAQNQIMKATIQGTVRDPQNLVVPGATVRVVPTGMDRAFETVTDENGSYAIYGLPPGRHRLGIRMPGFQDFESEELPLVLGETLVLDVTIQLAELTEEVTVRPSRFQRRSDYSSPANFIEREQIESLNMPTSEDVFNYQPSVTIRRRYIGDSNGTLGMRGANMFQTARSMVFADGVPIHNPLQTRWNGAPRWSLVAPDEVEAAEVIYGPFSAQYSGNSMGGVVKFKTVLPTERELRIDGNAFSQQFDRDGAIGDFNGYRLYTSYGDKIGKFSFKALYNGLSNGSQPQNYTRDDDGLAPAGSEPAVSGALATLSEVGRESILFGNTGEEQVDIHLFKVKTGYELSPDWNTRVTLAYESRDDRVDSPVNYLRDTNGRTIWGDGNNRTNDAQLDGRAFNVNNALFGLRDRMRESLFAGWEVTGRTGGNWLFDSTVSVFDILDDLSVDSSYNPLDPLDNGAGIITAFDDSGWMTLDLTLQNPVFLGSYDLSLTTGYHLDGQQIGVTQYASPDYRAGVRGPVTSAAGGQTSTQAIFAQLGWRFHPDWELTAGVRQEWWNARDGYAESGAVAVAQPDRDLSRTSPKVSLGFEPASRVRIQYSLAKAYRFPVPEELYDFEIRTYGTVLGDASLEPEDGTHQNLSVQYGLGNGHLEANLFRDDVKDTIFTQFQFVGGAPIFSFLPVDEVRTTGVEVVLDQPRIGGSKLDLQVNTTILESRIEEHALQPSWVGNDFPRMPNFRLGLFAVYHFNPTWLASVGARYSSDQFGNLDNSDTVDNVFGAIDSYLFLDVKLSYRFSTGGRFSFGVNNLTDEDAFVYHPWPQRTFFAEFAIDVGSDLLRSGS